MNMKMILSGLPSPLGDMLLACDEAGRVRALEFSERRSRLHRSLKEQYGTCSLVNGASPAAVVTALTRYFAGELAAIEAVEVQTQGTELQENVWSQLRRIPS